MPLLKQFLLSDEQRNQVRDCLHIEEMTLEPDAFDGFVAFLECAIREYHHAPRKNTKGSVREELRALNDLASRKNPPVDEIRRHAAELSTEALQHIERHAELILPLMFKGQYYDGSLRNWAEHVASDAALIEAVVSLIPDGAKPVPGRNRGKDKRSRDKMSPTILGVTLGAGEEANKKGRPRDDEQLALVRHLADCCERYTGQFPDVQRTDRSGFGSLVHAVFQWCGLSYDAAMYSLRQYADELQAVYGVNPVDSGEEA
jgi:hypothetical protein